MALSCVGQSALVTTTRVALVAALWCFLRGYQGFYGDAQLYAFQALAKIHTELNSDLFLKNLSQDRYSVFSALYSTVVRIVGLRAGTAALFFVFTTWLYAATWRLARAYGGRTMAWIGIGLLVVTAGDYGGSSVFHFSECYLSARLPAEALVVTALACHIDRYQRLAYLIAVAALFVHPLIALPGLLILLALRASIWIGIGAAAMLLLMATMFCMVAAVEPVVASAFPIMDFEWLVVVRERSQFLFPQFWRLNDWNINARPLLLLTFTAFAVRGPKLQKLCIASILVGASGLALALLPAVVSPVALLVQGQPWRWVWVSTLLCVLLFPIAIAAAWRERHCGPLCVLLLIDSWVMPGEHGSAFVVSALVLWGLKSRLRDKATAVLRWSATLGGIASLVWSMNAGWCGSIVILASSSRMLVTNLQMLGVVKLFAASAYALVIFFIAKTGRIAASALVGILVVAAGLRIPSALHGRGTFDIEENPNEFVDWTAAIPPTSTVFVTPSRDVGAFVWFTLLRPNYLSLDQSAGVAFSRATAVEVRRRSEVLKPLQPPSWQISSGLRNAIANQLDAALLRLICADPQLGFVIASEVIEGTHIEHTAPGHWMNWNLYDCATRRP